MAEHPAFLFSPTGILHYVRDRRAAAELAEQEGITTRNLYGLCGWQAKTDKSTEGWQPVPTTKWVQRVDSGEMLPVVGGSVGAFLKLHGQRADLKEVKEKPLADLLNGNYRTTSRAEGTRKSVKTNLYQGWRWADPPQDPVGLLRHFHAKGAFAPPSQVHM